MPRPPVPAHLLVCDVDGVLYRYDRSVRVATLARALGLGDDAVHDAVYRSGIEDAGDDGTLGPEAYLAALGDRLGLGAPLDRGLWTDARAAAMTPDTEALDLLAQVARRVPVATLSNNGTLLKQEAGRIEPELAALAARHDVAVEMFVAGEIRAAKPDPAAYLAVTGWFGVAPGDAAFVDDTQAHVDGARRAGLRAHLHTSVDALAGFLRAQGLLA
jgi:putative hydrolase of the HAD superfamily